MGNTYQLRGEAVHLEHGGEPALAPDDGRGRWLVMAVLRGGGAYVSGTARTAITGNLPASPLHRANHLSRSEYLSACAHRVVVAARFVCIETVHSPPRVPVPITPPTDSPLLLRFGRFGVTRIYTLRTSSQKINKLRAGPHRPTGRPTSAPPTRS